MKHETWARQDLLRLDLVLARDPIEHGPDGMVAFVDTLAKHGLSPTTLKANKKATRCSPDQIRRVFAKGVVNPFFFLRDSDPEFDVSMNVRGSTRLPYGCGVDVMIEMTYFEGADWRSHTKAIANLVRDLGETLQPIYGFAHSNADFGLTGDSQRTNRRSTDQVQEAYWLLLLGSALVDKIGRERVMSTPAFRIEALPDGSVLLLTTESPAHVTSEASRSAQAAAFAHLRGISLDEARARYTERDRQLAPVTPDWDPDMVDLIEQLCDLVPFSNRQAEIARFNAFRPAPVSEVRDPQPSDVADQAAAIAQYSLHAEQLVALLHSKVEEVTSNAPPALVELDIHFFRYDYPRVFERAQIDGKLIPAIGGYLGDVMVKHLGGRWVPRRNLDETQVVIGDRAWLPYLRAKHYMTSKQAALDYSLTKFFRVAQRGGE